MILKQFLEYSNRYKFYNYNLINNSSENDYINFSEYFTIFPQRLDYMVGDKIVENLPGAILGIKSNLSNVLEQKALKILSQKYKVKYDNYYNPNLEIVIQDGDIFLGKYARLHLTDSVSLSTNDYRAQLFLDNFEGIANLKGYNLKINTELDDINIYTISKDETSFGNILFLEVNKDGDNINKIIYDETGLEIRIGFVDVNNYNLKIKLTKDAINLSYKDSLTALINKEQIDIKYPQAKLNINNNNKKLVIEIENIDIICKILNISKDVLLKEGKMKFQNYDIDINNLNIIASLSGPLVVPGTCSTGACSVTFPNSFTIKINNTSFKIPLMV